MADLSQIIITLKGKGMEKNPLTPSDAEQPDTPNSRYCVPIPGSAKYTASAVIDESMVKYAYQKISIG